MKKNWIIFIVILAFAGGCKKYEDGPVISLRSKKERLANTWRVEKYYLNGADETSSIDTWLPNYTQTFTEKGNYSFNTTFIDGSGTWEFMDHKEHIKVVVTNGFGDDITDLTILRLKEKEFWYYYIDGADKHEFHLKPE